MTQNDSKLPTFKVQQPPKLQVSVETPSFECLGVLRCQPLVLGVEERCEKSVTAGEKFGFEDLLGSSRAVQGSSRAESSSPVQRSAASAKTALPFLPFAALFVQLCQSLFPVEINFSAL